MHGETDRIYSLAILALMSATSSLRANPKRNEAQVVDHSSDVAAIQHEEDKKK